MLVSKDIFITAFAKSLAKKLGIPLTEETLSSVSSSLQPIFTEYFARMKKEAIIVDDLIDTSALKEELIRFFIMVPTFNIPFGSITISITREDVVAFIDLVEEDASKTTPAIIYLPCQN